MGGVAIVKLNGKYNFINPSGQILSQQWFNEAMAFQPKGFARVKLNDKWNLINAEGQFVSNLWFDWIGDFNE